MEDKVLHYGKQNAVKPLYIESQENHICGLCWQVFKITAYKALYTEIIPYKNALHYQKYS
jgi:hypothetical protein